MATENTHIFDFRLTHKIFTLYSRFCTSLSIALKFVLLRSDVEIKRKFKFVKRKFKFGLFGLSEKVKWFSAQRNLISKGLTYLFHVKPTERNVVSSD